jgi:hypothetical protein
MLVFLNQAEAQPDACKTRVQLRWAKIERIKFFTVSGYFNEQLMNMIKNHKKKHNKNLVKLIGSGRSITTPAEPSYNRRANEWNQHRDSIKLTNEICTCVPCHPPPVGFVAQQTNQSQLGFEAQLKKTIVVILSLKSPNRSYRFWGTNRKICRSWFWGSIKKPVLLISLYTVQIIHGVTRPPDLPILQPPSTRPVIDHLRSFAACLLLLHRSSSLPVMSHLSHTHHETSKCDFPHKIHSSRITEMSQIQIQKWHINDSSQLNQGTDHLVSQSLHWWVHWKQKTQSSNFESKTPWNTSRRPKAKEKLKNAI